MFNMSNIGINYYALMQIPFPEVRLAECIRLAQQFPFWDWGRKPMDCHAQVIQSHENLLAFLREQPGFALVASPFLAKWHRRGAIRPVTSDHQLVTNTFEKLDEARTTITYLRVSSFNLGNKFHSRQQCNHRSADGQGMYANNPEDIDETEFQYELRKLVQFDQIISHLVNVEKKVDALFLQEIDFLLKPGFLKDTFTNRLQQASYELIFTSPYMNARPQAIIYNKAKLTIGADDNGHSLIPGTSVGGRISKNTIFEAKFIHNVSGEKLCLASVHLDYAGDYSRVMNNYCHRRVAEGYMTIWGGDTNHTPGYEIPHLIDNHHYATNYDVASNGLLTVIEPNGQVKAYDGFGGGAQASFRLKVVNETQYSFRPTSINGYIELRRIPNEYRGHDISLPGRPWENRSYIVLYKLGFKAKMAQALLRDLQDQGWAEQQIKVSVDGVNSLNSIDAIFQFIEKTGSGDFLSKTKEIIAQAHCLTMDDEQLSNELISHDNELKVAQEMETGRQTYAKSLQLFNVITDQKNLGGEVIEASGIRSTI